MDKECKNQPIEIDRLFLQSQLEISPCFPALEKELGNSPRAFENRTKYLNTRACLGLLGIDGLNRRKRRQLEERLYKSYRQRRGRKVAETLSISARLRISLNHVETKTGKFRRAYSY